MGCSSSRLEDEEAVQFCNERRNFVKQAVEQRYRFALSHISYMDSLDRVSVALLNFVERNEHHDFLMDRYSTTCSSPVNHLMSPKVKTSRPVVNCLRSSGNHTSIPMEEWIRVPETIHIQSLNNLDGDGFFTFNSSQSNNSSFFTVSPSNSITNGPISYPPLSPQNSQWDHFWNPFSSLNQHTYQNDNEDEEILSVKVVRKREGIPDLEEVGVKEEEGKINIKSDNVDNDNEEEEKSCDEEQCVEGENEKAGNVGELKELRTQGADSSSIEVSQAQDTVQSDDTPLGFTVYVNRRPSSMVEVIKDINSQFERILDASREVGVMLEAHRALYSAPTQITGVNIFSRPSSRSSSFRLLLENTNVNNRREEEMGEESNSNYSEECGMIAGSHQSTLERLYAWEKKLYDEVKSAELIRLAYEKKCMQLKRHDANGDEPSMVDKTRSIIRDLGTQLKVSLHSVESVSQRIKTLSNEELFPQLLELIQGLARMWRAVAESHGIQKQIIEEAKLLLFSSSSGNNSSSLFLTESETNNHSTSKVKPSKYAMKLINEVKQWGLSLSSLANAQRSYVHALASWISQCARPLVVANNAAAEVDTHNDDDSDEDGNRRNKIVFRRGAPPLCALCMSWSEIVSSVKEGKVVKGMEFLRKGIEGVSRKQREEGALAHAGGGGAVVVAGERLAEVGEKVLCAGLSEVVGPLKEFAVCSRDGYEGLVRKYLEFGRTLPHRVDEDGIRS